MINKDTYKRLTKSNIFTCPNCIQGSIVGEDDCFVEDTVNLRYHIDTKIYDRLVELEDKIENGTLFEPTCKVGDIVYRIWTYSNGGYVQDYTIVKIEIYEDEILLFDDSDNQIQITDIGKTVFLTKAEAEARLKELDNSYKENGGF